MNFPKISWLSLVCASLVLSAWAEHSARAQIPVIRPATVEPRGNESSDKPSVPIVSPVLPGENQLIPVEQGNSQSIPVESRPASQLLAPIIPSSTAGTSIPVESRNDVGRIPIESRSNALVVPIEAKPSTAQIPVESRQDLGKIPVESAPSQNAFAGQLVPKLVPPVSNATAVSPQLPTITQDSPVVTQPTPMVQGPKSSSNPGEFNSFLAPISIVPQPPRPQTTPAVESGPVVPRVAMQQVTPSEDLEFELRQMAGPATTRVAAVPRPEPGRQDYFNPEPMGQGSMGMANAGCPHCGGSGCEHCGGEWGNQGYPDDGGYGYGADIGNFGQFDNCGFVPRASVYGIVDALSWTRTKGSFIGTTFGGLSGFDEEWGLRATLGARTDNVSGYELSFLGIIPLEQSRVITSPFGGINALFTPEGGFTFANVSAFFNGNDVRQFAKSSIYSVEFNRVRWGWDIVKTHIGLRYLYFDDSYLLQSTNVFNSVGEMELNARNNLFGGNAGIDLFYDVGRRVSFSWFAKGGAYVNAQRNSFELTNNGIQFVNNVDSNSRFAFSLDLGVYAHIHLRQNARLRAGYSGIYLWNVSSASENYPQFLTPLTGLSSDTKMSLLFHGPSIGLEFYR